MVLCINLTSQAKSALDCLLQAGEFRDNSEAVSMALINYHVIHQAVSEGDAVGVGDIASTKASQKTTSEAPGTKINGRFSRVPELLRLQSSALDDSCFADIADASAAEIPPAYWLFGQYNKFLPVKVSCRCLLNMLCLSPEGVPLVKGTETISSEAWVLGDYLYMLDQESSRSREDAFAAAFPTTAGNGARSRSRFANQFVGDLRQPIQPDGKRQVKFNGLPAALQFIVCTNGKNPLMQLTKPGAEFSLLQNPILEAGAVTPDGKFSEAEIEFMLAHFRRAVPEEISAYSAIIDAIAGGANTPDAVDQYLCQKFNLEIAMKAEEENQITQTFLTTQRTGAISRMV